MYRFHKLEMWLNKKYTFFLSVVIGLAYCIEKACAPFLAQHKRI